MSHVAPPDYTAYELALQDTVGFGEGTIKQDAKGNWVKNPKLWFGYKDHVDPTKLNFHQLMEAQKSFLRAGKGSFYGGDSAAVGWAQMTYPETYREAAGLKMTDLFTEKNQNKLFLHYAAKEAGVTPKMLAEQGFTKEISTRLGKPWASMWGSKHGQKTKSYESLRDFFNQRLAYHQKATWPDRTLTTLNKKYPGNPKSRNVKIEKTPDHVGNMLQILFNPSGR